MSTTLSRSLALLISMFALTSSFSLSMNPVELEDSWIVEVVESKNTGISTSYFVNKGKLPVERKQEHSAFYKEVMKYQVRKRQNMEEFISKKLNGKFGFIFRVSRSNYKNVTVGVISEGCTLHLFCAIYNLTSTFCYKKYLLDKTNNTFFAKEEMKETQDGILRLYFNGKSNKTIEVNTVKFMNLSIASCSNYLAKQTYIRNKANKKITRSKDNSRDKNSHILFWSSIFIAFAFTAIYVIYKYWWLPRKRSL